MCSPGHPGFDIGYRIVGPVTARRRSTGWRRAYAAYCTADESVMDPSAEAYLSAYCFPRDVQSRIEAGSLRGYEGPVDVPHLHFDIDRENDLAAALDDVRKLAGYLADRYHLDEEVAVFFSGSKGFHVLLPASLFGFSAGDDVHRVCRALATRLAESTGVTIDPAVYDKLRPFRAPNSQHSKTRLHKVRLDIDTLLRTDLDGIRSLARNPLPFEPAADPQRNETAVADREAAEAEVRTAVERRGTVGNTYQPMLTRATREFLRDGAEGGERNRRLFSAAANLAEFGCPERLAFELLEEIARDSGLPPREIAATVRKGLAHVAGSVQPEAKT